MTTEAKDSMMCHLCTKVACRYHYPEGVPAYCMATKFHSVLEQTKTEYSTPDVSDIFKASAAVSAKGVEPNGHPRWPRIQEAIEFAKELKLIKIGLASCAILLRELGLVAELFTGAVGNQSGSPFHRRRVL